MSQHSILIVDDEPNILNSLKRILRRQDYKLFLVGNAYDGLDILENNDIHLIISDQMMPRMKGTEFLKWAKQKKPQTVRILLTAFADIQNAIEAINQAGVFRFISKPWINEELILTVERALEHYDILHDLNSLMAVFQNRRSIIKKLMPLAHDEEMAGDSIYIDSGEYDEFDLDDLVNKYWEAENSQGTMSIQPEQKTKQQKYSILVVDDDPLILDIMENILKSKFQFFRAQDAYQGLEILEKEYIHLVISDNIMPGITGTDFLKQVMQKYPYTMRVLMTGFATLRDLMDAINSAEIYHFIPKPFRVEEVFQTVKRAMEYYELRQDLKTLIVLFQNQQEILKKLPEALKDTNKGNIHYISEKDLDDEALEDLIQKYWEKNDK